jgi:hypothetical protein
MPLTYRQALDTFAAADNVLRDARSKMQDAERVLGHARTAYDLAYLDRKDCMYAAEDAFRREEHAAGRPVTADTKPATDERTAPC